MQVKIIKFPLFLRCLFFILAFEIVFVAFFLFKTVTLTSEVAWYLTYLSLSTLILFIVSVAVIGKVWLYFKPYPKRSTIFIGSLILVLGLIFRLQQPFDHFIFHDEEANIHAAQMIKGGYLSRDCSFGVFEKGSLQCFRKADSIPLKKEGYSFILAISSLFLGNNYLVIGILLNIIFALGAVILSFFIGKLLWSEIEGLFAAMMVSLLPLNIQWSVTTSLEISSLFLILLGSLFFILYLQQKKYFLFFLSLLTFNYAAFTRPEIIVLLPIVIIFFLINRPNPKALLTGLGILMSILMFLFSFVNVLFSVTTPSFYKGYIKFENVTSIYSLDFFKDNLIKVIKYNTQFKELILLISFFAAVIGFFTVLRDKKIVAPKIFILILGLALFVAHTSYYFGSYKTMGILHDRFPMLWIGVLSPLVGMGISSVVKLIKTDPKILILASSVVFSVYIQINFQKLFQPSPQQIPFKERHVILQFQKANPDCLYVSPVAFREFSNGYNAIDPHTFKDYSQSELILKQKCIIMFDSYQCRWNNNDVCRELLEKYSWRKLPYDKIETWQLML